MKAKYIFFGIVIIVFAACSSKTSDIKLKITNETEVDRNAETVEVLESSLTLPETVKFNELRVFEATSAVEIPSQFLDNNMDGNVDALIFQPIVKGGQTVEYILKKADNPAKFESKVYSRFVPERTDDYAWENDKVAFRTFGPEAQRMIEEDIPGGTLSSGMDCWLKRVDYPIINKWYEKDLGGTGSYHEDTGEGLDNFHVGVSRGCGGLGVFKEDVLYTSKNFTSYKTMGEGPIRTSFELDYANWTANNDSITEKKIIELDLGNNLMKVTAYITGTDQVTVGLTLHEKDGETSVDTSSFWFSYWEPHGDSELGTAIVCLPKYYLGYKKCVVDDADKSHLLVHLKVIDGKVEYYTGFGWKKSGQFETKEDWEAYLDEFSSITRNPLEIE